MSKIEIGVGALGAAMGESSDGVMPGGGTWRTAPILELAQYSPQLALARAWRVQFGPYLLSCRATFTDPKVQTLNPVSLEGNGKAVRIADPCVVDRLVFEVDAPDANAGALGKSQADFYFGLQSGIEATLVVDGGPGYAVAPFFTPIRTLMAMVAEGWPMGWMLGYTQGITMQFQSTIPLPSNPTTVIATFRMWHPVGTAKFMNMSTVDAFTELRKALKALGYDGAKVDAAIDVIANAPTYR